MPRPSKPATPLNIGSEPSSPAVSVRGLSKDFPGVRALKRIDFTLEVGEVHGLVGQNGAGKSTLIKILTGAYEADSGMVEIFGQRLGHGPRAQARAGIAAIYQELTVVPEMSAAANMFLGRPMHASLFLRQGAMEARFRALAGELGVDIPPRARAGSLSVANQQMVEIMRALEADHRILIMDEPTASLGPHERERLYETVRRLRENGTAIIYISHDLDEVLRLCDRVSVMRDGELVACKDTKSWTKESLVGAMLGTTAREAAAGGLSARADEALRVEHLSVRGLVHDLSFTLHQGEILGIAGLVGSGRTELLRALAGCQPGASGHLTIEGRSHDLPRSVRRALALGIALTPEDRKAQGLVLTQSGTVNLTLTDLAKFARGPFLRFDKRRRNAEAIAASLAFDPKRLSVMTNTLSGGNQQKLVVGKWLHRPPHVLLMDEPTRGIDVGAKAEMFAVMRRLAHDGLAIIMVSSELEEVLDNADRVLVLAKGRQRAMLGRAEASITRVLNLIFAVEEQAA